MKTTDLAAALAAFDGPPRRLMEVCGTHTAAISESGIPSLLPPTVQLISGPGCPVCVTVSAYIDRLIGLATAPDTCVVTFGDLLRVKGSAGDLRSTPGARTEMVYTPFRALELAERDPATRYVFAAVGFETTAPIYALLCRQIIERGISNLQLLTALKTMPAVIRTLCADSSCTDAGSTEATGTDAGGTDVGDICKNAPIDGFIAPGHVATVIGSAPFAALAEELHRPFAVAGFTPTSLLAAIWSLLQEREGVCRNFYPSAVTEDGNPDAMALVERYFAPCDAAWRGLGVIKDSGLCLRAEFAALDAGSAALIYDHTPAGCHCGQVITGRFRPCDCPLYGKVCTPDAPVGACMVSAEGACYHHYLNQRN